MKNLQRMVLMVLVWWGIGIDSYAQVPMTNDFVKVWDKTYGGSEIDYPYKSIKTQDGGILFIGASASNIGFEKTENSIYNSIDFWLLKIDANGIKQWDKTIGTHINDFAALRELAIRQTDDEGYIFTCSSQANKGGDKSDDNADPSSLSSNNVWIVRLDKKGTKLWDKTYGGTGYQAACDIILNENGFLVVTSSASLISGNKTIAQRAMGGRDILLLQLDANGNKQWEKVLGSLKDNEVFGIEKFGTHFIILAKAAAANGDNTTGVANNVWVVKIDVNGNKIWDKSFLVLPTF